MRTVQTTISPKYGTGVCAIASPNICDGLYVDQLAVASLHRVTCSTTSTCVDPDADGIGKCQCDLECGCRYESVFIGFFFLPCDLPTTTLAPTTTTPTPSPTATPCGGSCPATLDDGTLQVVDDISQCGQYRPSRNFDETGTCIEASSICRAFYVDQTGSASVHTEICSTTSTCTDVIDGVGKCQCDFKCGCRYQTGFGDFFLVAADNDDIGANDDDAFTDVILCSVPMC